MKYTQKGAMFGLDARIALAIFGALSVITGAALYSAIQDSKVVSILTEMDNIDKAITSHYLDTGVYPAISADATRKGYGQLKSEELVSSATTGWLGPYLTFTSGTDKLVHASYGDITVFRKLDSDWSATTAGACTNGDACSIFICYAGIPADVNKALDVKIDGVLKDGDDKVISGAAKGNYRYSGTVGCKKGSLYDSSLV